MKEQIIREGDTVLIAGVYSEDKGGIAPDPDTGRTIEPVQSRLIDAHQKVPVIDDR